MVFRAETTSQREWQDILKQLKEKTCSQEYYVQQDYHSDLKEK